MKNGANDFRALRIAAGLTQSALAERAGCTQMAVSYIERGLHMKNSRVARNMAKALTEAFAKKRAP